MEKLEIRDYIAFVDPYGTVETKALRIQNLAEKVNEIIDYLNFIEHKLGNQSNMAEFNQMKSLDK